MIRLPAVCTTKWCKKAFTLGKSLLKLVPLILLTCLTPTFQINKRQQSYCFQVLLEDQYLVNDSLWNNYLVFCYEFELTQDQILDLSVECQLESMVLLQLFRILSVVGCYVSHIQGSRKIEVTVFCIIIWNRMILFCLILVVSR